MKHFEYVTKEQARPYREVFRGIIQNLQKNIKGDFTFQYKFIGSSSRNMITFDPTTNIGFDFDINLEMNYTSDDFTAEELRTTIFNQLQQFAKKNGYKIENGTRVITLKKVSTKTSKIQFSCDIAVVNNYTDDEGYERQEYIRFNKNHTTYTWEQQTSPYDLDYMIDAIKENDMWQDVRVLYLYKKNTNTDIHKKSRSLYAETIKEIYDLL
ncbi:hypothetical protein SAMN02910377_00660 [Pseudobutyrivibrio ruminis]|uniref:Uncharacterized protein n=1 Tax=Pseudobutyrivibrio ruminis TaxID=46206 RepID=A0A1H7G7T6_9FIRM|nr:hypothetical protein [Pseudobutyrivibrio ruminis]SEK34201.1 hypothetical protein SAMN02910377_00660 [Pseudobutyrivibrio ruminis]